MNDVANDTLPVPTGSNTLDTYGNVIRGKMNDDIVRIVFIIKFHFNDFFFSILPLSYDSFLKLLIIRYMFLFTYQITIFFEDFRMAIQLEYAKARKYIIIYFAWKIVTQNKIRNEITQATTSFVLLLFVFTPKNIILKNGSR